MTLAEKLVQAMRESQPDWRVDGGVRGKQETVVQRSAVLDFASAKITERATQGEIPAFKPTPLPDRAAQSSASALKLPFALTLKKSGGVVKVKVRDGYVNGVFPTGMGSDNYELTITNPADAIIYAIMTYNPDTLAVLSTDLGVSTAADFPASEIVTTPAPLATVVVQIGFVYVQDDKPVVLNSIAGDINYALIYGARNGAPAMLPVKTYTDWIALPTP